MASHEVAAAASLLERAGRHEISALELDALERRLCSLYRKRDEPIRRSAMYRVLWSSDASEFLRGLERAKNEHMFRYRHVALAAHTLYNEYSVLISTAEAALFHT